MIFVVSSRERAFPVYLAFLSYYDVIPVLQESLCYKGMRDEDSIEMMNLVLETEVVDLTTAAGIANGEDVYNTIIAGADATGSSSGVARAADRPAMVEEMIAAVRRAWDARNK